MRTRKGCEVDAALREVKARIFSVMFVIYTEVDPFVLFSPSPIARYLHCCEPHQSRSRREDESFKALSVCGSLSPMRHIGPNE